MFEVVFWLLLELPQASGAVEESLVPVGPDPGSSLPEVLLLFVAASLADAWSGLF